MGPGHPFPVSSTVSTQRDEPLPPCLGITRCPGPPGLLLSSATNGCSSQWHTGGGRLSTSVPLNHRAAMGGCGQGAAHRVIKSLPAPTSGSQTSWQPRPKCACPLFIQTHILDYKQCMQLPAAFVVLWDALQSSPGTSAVLLLAISDPPRLPLGAGRSHCAQSFLPSLSLHYLSLQ